MIEYKYLTANSTEKLTELKEKAMRAGYDVSSKTVILHGRLVTLARRRI